MSPRMQINLFALPSGLSRFECVARRPESLLRHAYRFILLRIGMSGKSNTGGVGLQAGKRTGFRLVQSFCACNFLKFGRDRMKGSEQSADIGDRFGQCDVIHRNVGGSGHEISPSLGGCEIAPGVARAVGEGCVVPPAARDSSTGEVS